MVFKPIRETFDDHWIAKSGPLDTDCWIWQRCIDSGGYGMLNLGIGESPERAHRFSRIRSNDQIPYGMCGLHRCDVRPCVRPDHLFIGSYLENNRDRHLKGRSASHKGENNGRANLCDVDVHLVRDLHESGQTYRAIAKWLEIPLSTITNIIRRHTWTYI